jgi:DNA-binding NarL/FixJ family response regulator
MPHQILIVDDQAVERRALERYLSRELGYAVTAAAGAQEAFTAALATPFDLAIIYTQLAPVSGIEAYMRLKSIQPELQVVFLTGGDELGETDKDFLRFSVPEERVMARPRGQYAQLTRLIISILGPPIA